ncbi:Calcineurin-like phosphoesterase [Giardia muris]|uniref:Calcineurin-like phosphoesterase n=1 Tax=Giardia muris TaxID=5742 RepID=A0A4Z1T4P8_GIAMU|nr:Calcineurin-like phosphoesterase [Giardia muris]|eukprot:TNJ27499.1 Calcineurin-like phosphoesterase [Giardia muris]
MLKCHLFQSCLLVTFMVIGVLLAICCCMWLLAVSDFHAEFDIFGHLYLISPLLFGLLVLLCIYLLLVTRAYRELRASRYSSPSRLGLTSLILSDIGGCFILGLLFALCVYYFAALAPDVPSLIQPYLTPLGETLSEGLQINWYSEEKVGSFSLEVSEGVWEEREVVRNDGFNHVRLDSLIPGRTYRYRIPEIYGGEYEVRIPALDGEDETSITSDTIRVAICTDLHALPGASRAYLPVLHEIKPVLGLVLGDLVTTGTSLSQWRRALQSSGPFGYFNRVPVLALSGNHETYGCTAKPVVRKWMLSAFAPKREEGSSAIPNDILSYIPEELWDYYGEDFAPLDEGFYHAIVLRDVLIIALDCMDDVFRTRHYRAHTGMLLSPRQILWLSDTLKKYENDPRIRFRVIAVHVQLYTSTHGPAQQPLTALLEPYICRYKINLVLSGHKHALEVVHRQSRCLELGYGQHSFYAVTVNSLGGHPYPVALPLFLKSRQWRNIMDPGDTPLVGYGMEDLIHGEAIYGHCVLELRPDGLWLQAYRLRTGELAYEVCLAD